MRIPLIRVRYIQGYLALMQAVGIGNPHKVLHLPYEATEQAEGFLPVHVAHRAVTTAIGEGVNDLGKVFADQTPLVPPSGIQGKTLLESLFLSCLHAPEDYTPAAFHLTTDGDSAWFYHEWFDDPEPIKSEFECALISHMIQQVQFAVPGWLPRSIRVQSQIQARMESLGIPDVHLGMVTGFQIPGVLLWRKILTRNSTAIQGDAASSHVRQAVELIVRNIVTIRPSLELVCDLSGIPARSLQRALHDEGTTYSEILADAVMTEAVQRLRTSTAAQVARDLRFASQSHFTRAFRKRFGVSPAKFYGGVEM